ncbi:AHH domain-containing protein [Hydrogenophaga sp.]|uniref:AHH domain-containing protein n=1 Tax=Hydrogenophaga sp. TaxID=1904254 RepID=UPI002604B58E|nr:AHH domain-containing protein [Hydrogenophaga sp.]MDM7951207.1 AHH domain-containing protein [Hydrogenophaga sp.]
MLTGLSTVATTDATGAAKFSAVRTGPVRATGYGYNTNSLNTTIVERTDGVETQRWTLAYNASGDLTRITDVTGGNQSATLTNDAHGRLTRLAASNGAVATFAWNADGRMTAATLPGYSASFTYTAQKRLNEVRLNTGEWLRVTYNAKGEPTQVLNSSGQVQTVSGLSQHWLQSDQPLNALQTLLARSLEQGPQRLGDLLIKSAMAQVPVPPMPGGLVGGLAAAGGAASRGADPDLPAASGCCGGGLPTDREIQERFQRTLPFTLMQGAVGLMDALTRDILTMKGRSDLRKNFLCSKQQLPTKCWEAHHIVAFAADAAEPARIILRDVGIDINSIENGVPLECDKHKGLHTTAYYLKVNTILALSPKNRSDIALRLREIATAIQLGTF